MDEDGDSGISDSKGRATSLVPFEGVRSKEGKGLRVDSSKGQTCRL